MQKDHDKFHVDNHTLINKATKSDIHHDKFHVDNHTLINKATKSDIHHKQRSCTSIHQTKQNSFVCICAPLGYESDFN
jgi:hypothetical protein